MPLAAPRFASPTPLVVDRRMRLLSYNIHKGIGGRDRRYRLSRVIDVILQEDPDIVCLQEVDRHVRRSSHHDQPRLLCHELAAADHRYQLNVRLQSGGYGNLILSRWPLRESHHLSLRLRSKKPRGAQLALVDTPSGTLHLVHWHLGLAEAERDWQVRHLLAHDAFKQAEHLPTIVVGDFNDWRNRLGPEVFEPVGFLQATTPVSRYRTFPAYMAIASLDKAFYRHGVDLRKAFVPGHALAREASDHLPLVIEFYLRHTEQNQVSE